jgi:hypothetical protein
VRSVARNEYHLFYDWGLWVYRLFDHSEPTHKGLEELFRYGNQWERKVAGRRGYKEIDFLAGWRFGPLILKVGASPSQLIYSHTTSSIWIVQAQPIHSNGIYINSHE